MNNYKIHENYRDDQFLRNEFFNLIEKIFPSADFKEWYLKGFWEDNYIPYSILKDNKIVSSVCISEMEIFVKGGLLKGIQFSAVGTLPEYRKQGLSKILMEHVLDKYKASTDIFFLFANDGVLDFYPKFGFKKYDEVVFKSQSNIPEPNFSARQLNIENETDLELVKNLLKKRLPITRLFCAVDFGFITMWHIFNFYSKSLLYLDLENVIFIVTEEDDQLHLWDVIYDKPFDFYPVISKVIKSNSLKSINYYFSPDQLNFEFDETVPYIDSPLFIMGDFKLQGENFKFPATAQT